MTGSTYLARTLVSQYLEIGQTIETCMHGVGGWMNELRVACELWSMEVCEVSLTENPKGKPAKRRLGRVQENLEIDSPWLHVLP